MKKIILLSSVLCVLAATSANAQISVTVGQPVYVERPVYYTPPLYTVEYHEYYNRYPHHARSGRGRGDWSYWAKKHKEKDEWHDNGNHGEGNRGNGYGNRR